MSIENAIKFFDNYNRIARIYPALITLAPVVWTAALLVPTIAFDFSGSAIALLASGCFFYFLASLARSRGKILEQRLNETLGGWPTTILLRHRDSTIDAITKERYHKALSKLSDAVQLPTAAEELQSPGDADNAYRSATKRLIEARRDPRYQMLHDENASYGFRRNLLSLKPVAVAIALISIGVVLTAWWMAIATGLTWSAILTAGKTYPKLPVVFVLDLVYLATALMLVRSEFVLQAAREYADALFRTLDAPSNS